MVMCLWVGEGVYLKVGSTSIRCWADSLWELEPWAARIFYKSDVLLSALPLPCSNNCRCHYMWEQEANVFNCSDTNITSLAQLQIPNETTWFIAKSNHIPHLDWSENLHYIQHFDLQNSSIRYITDDFISKIKTMNRIKFLNLARNNLKTFPKTFSGTHFSQVYLAGNPIDCNCEMLWLANWLNVTNNQSESRIVKDYKQVVCAGGKWNGTQVYKLSSKQMGCDLAM